MVGKFKIGEAGVSVLGIAAVRRDLDQIAEIFPTVGREALRSAIKTVQPDSGGEYLDWYFNATLIQIPNQTILVDTGFGFSAGAPGLGTAQLLAECGVQVEEVNTIVITHGHGDHIGGLSEDGAPTMPNARVVISRQEYEFWMNGNADRHFGAKGAAAQKTTLSLCRDQIECIDMDFPIAESDGTIIRTLPAPGHTPGHIGISVSSQGERLWLLVDTIHTLFQLDHPDWSPRFDVDPYLSRTTRKALLEQAARLGVSAHLYHFPFPALGYIEASDQA
ncbi:MAG: MBL fold metallo-hydrolase, partial [Spirochaetaceae bacterium]